MLECPGKHCSPSSPAANQQEVTPMCYHPTKNQQRAETWKCELVILFEEKSINSHHETEEEKLGDSQRIIPGTLYFRYSRLSHPFRSALWLLQDDPAVWLDLSVMVNANLWWLFPRCIQISILTSTNVASTLLHNFLLFWGSRQLAHHAWETLFSCY